MSVPLLATSRILPFCAFLCLLLLGCNMIDQFDNLIIYFYLLPPPPLLRSPPPAPPPGLLSPPRPRSSLSRISSLLSLRSLTSVFPPTKFGFRSRLVSTSPLQIQTFTPILP